MQSLRSGRIIESLRGDEVHLFAVDVGPVRSSYMRGSGASQTVRMVRELASYELK